MNEDTKGTWLWFLPGLLFSILGYFATLIYKHTSPQRASSAKLWAGTGVACNAAIVFLGFGNILEIPAKISASIGAVLLFYAMGCTIYLVVLKPLGSIPKALKKLKSFHDSTKME